VKRKEIGLTDHCTDIPKINYSLSDDILLSANKVKSKPKKASKLLRKSSNETPRELKNNYASVGIALDLDNSNKTPTYLNNKSSVDHVKNNMRSTHTSFLYSFSTSSQQRRKDKTLSSSMNAKHFQRSRSDKNRKILKADSKSQSFKLSSRPNSKNMGRLGDRKDHSANSRSGTSGVADLRKPKDYFGSKRNEVRYNKMKKKNVKNPLNIMTRAVINLNNSRTNSESSYERLSKSRERSTGPNENIKTYKVPKLDGVTKFRSVYNENLESKKPKPKSASTMTTYGILKI
jgi:hypothetical protein